MYIEYTIKIICATNEDKTYLKQTFYYSTQ